VGFPSIIFVGIKKNIYIFTSTIQLKRIKFYLYLLLFSGYSTILISNIDLLYWSRRVK